MKFIKLTEFKTNTDLVKELADKISGTEDSWQTLDYIQYPSIMRILSDNNLINIREINISTRVGPTTRIVPPANDYDPGGDIINSPYRLYIPLSGVNTTLAIGDESMEINSPIAAMSNEEMISTIPAGVSHMLRIIIKDSESIGINRYITAPEKKMESFARFFGLI